MIQEKAKKTIKRPKTGSDSAPLTFTASGREVPEIDSVLNEIDKVLVRTLPKKQKLCGC